MKKLRMFEIKEKEKESIENEILLLSQLHHPNIVSYKENFIDSNKDMYIVMDYCEDGDLYKRIRVNGTKQLSESQIVDWISQMLLAIHFLHDRKILHRDIKTQNIFISKGNLFLGDFGISKSLDNTRELANTVS